MPPFKDYTGYRFGSWEVLEYSHHNASSAIFKVRCLCGNEGLRSIGNLRRREYLGCNCPVVMDLTGKRFGKWQVIKRHSRPGNRSWEVVCDCGNQYIVQHRNLTLGMSKQCRSCAARKYTLEIGEKVGKVTISKIYREGKQEVVEVVCDCGTTFTRYLENFIESIRAGSTVNCGCVSTPYKLAKLGLLKYLQENIDHVDTTILKTLLRKAGLYGYKHTKSFISSVLKLPQIKDKQKFLVDLRKDVENSKDDQEDISAVSSEDDLFEDIFGFSSSEYEEDFSFISGNPNETEDDVLKVADYVLGGTSEEAFSAEYQKFLIRYFKSKLWGTVINQESQHKRTVNRYKPELHGQLIRDEFIQEYEAVQALWPELQKLGYRFKKSTQTKVPTKPYLSQLLTAYRAREDRRLGVFSGTGAGKTLGALIASRVCHAQVTVLVVLNNTIEQWVENIDRTFADVNVIVKERGELELDPDRPNYVIFNYESFQLEDSEQLVQNLLDHRRIDFIILDEIHFTKQRGSRQESKRRRLISHLIKGAEEINPGLRVMGMSATPVINTLYEGRAMLEMVTGKDLSHVPVTDSPDNALGLYELLVSHGVRHRKIPDQKLETKVIPIYVSGLEDQLVELDAAQPLPLEQMLLEAKLDTIRQHLKPGAIIYTHYVEGIADQLVELCEKAGFTCGLFIGEDKSGLKKFKSGEIDILIGSSTLGTGIDGLQEVCDRIIVANLPWTNSAFEQLVGRVYRANSKFETVEVIIPQVVLDVNGEEWSWDRNRFDRIKFKKTLSDAVVDGIYSDEVLVNENDLRKQVLGWLKEQYESAKREHLAQTV